MKIAENNKLKNSCKIILALCIFLYPFIHSFLGIDLGDTGIHMYIFDNLYDTPELIGFTSYFTGVVGWLWFHCFEGLGLWGLNLLEVIIEMLMAIVVYRTFKDYLGECKTLFGVLVAIVASDTYLNVFNYHQFNVFLLIIILCCEFKACVTEKVRYSLVSGIAFSVVVFSRMGSITAVVTLFFYIIWSWISKKNIKFVIKNIIVFLSASTVTAFVLLLLLKVTGQLQYFMENILRLFGLASADDGGYSMDNLLGKFISGNLDAIASGVIVLSGTIILLMGVDLLLKKEETLGKKLTTMLISIITIAIAIYQLIYAYDVNPAPAWPQMTTGPSYFIGVFYVVTFFCMIYHLYSKKGKREIALIAMEAIVLPLLTIAGSNTGTKHVVIAFWIIAPVVVYTLGTIINDEKIRIRINEFTMSFGLETGKKALIITMLIVCGSMGVKFVHMAYNTMNFDSTDRGMLNSTINCDRVKWLRTTEREAYVVNGVLRQIERVEDDRPLIVYGGSMLFYYMTERNAFVQPWFSNTNYSDNRLEKDIENGYEKYEQLPIVIYGRTNNYFGFSEVDYNYQLKSETERTYGEKKERLLSFLEEHEYKLEYLNDYYLVLFPPDIAYTGERYPEGYEGYITGKWSE